MKKIIALRASNSCFGLSAYHYFRETLSPEQIDRLGLRLLTSKNIQDLVSRSGEDYLSIKGIKEYRSYSLRTTLTQVVSHLEKYNWLADKKFWGEYKEFKPQDKWILIITPEKFGEDPHAIYINRSMGTLKVVDSFRDSIVLSEHSIYNYFSQFVKGSEPVELMRVEYRSEDALDQQIYGNPGAKKRKLAQTV
jgi:hypothetical protein